MEDNVRWNFVNPSLLRADDAVQRSPNHAVMFLFCSHFAGSVLLSGIGFSMQNTIRIIGIDPGLRRTGWGIIDTLGNSLRFVASGTVISDGDMDLASRLCQLHDGLADVIHSHKPDEAAVEQTFVNKDAVATLKLGQARGIAMLVPARAGLQVSEYAPNAVKKAVIGVGHGEKQQIHMMLKILMPKAEFKGNDAADALAIAICHAHNRGAARMRMAALAG
jgi:crossover junction endodeoxyribonuclease RuvC